ncbi:MAG: DUF885 family protein [Candidatus Marinimicrobia bacterium]|jgi:hypothetical protein|nr:DUF885 family protein [Candidatus Neomarinimicrobiota bacterium]MDP7059606.1 DUF885 family protein [Candidatus Neomarinimicrobiota bacterium]|tara:strand:+ start:1820 stop:3499 length:1680 start_codon:yes stop_codon:yes gene_type:complete
MKTNFCYIIFSFILGLFSQTSFLIAGDREDSEELHSLIDRALEVFVPTKSEKEYQEAVEHYKSILNEIESIDYTVLSLDDQVDYDLLVAHLKTRIFEYDIIELYKVHPVSYFVLGKTNRLFTRPGAIADSGVKEAIKELNTLPIILDNARDNLTNPARVWTENAIYQAYYAKILLTDFVPEAVADDPALKKKLIQSANTALKAVNEFEHWLEQDLLKRSKRSPTWKPKEIEYYQFVHEQLDDYDVDAMLVIASREENETRKEMENLADLIHPSGELKIVWKNMKDEAPPWEGVLPMAQSFVDMASAWLNEEGSHVVTIPDYIDYGARITAPMARRTLSFGGATRGPTVAGRQSGYYILTPLEDQLNEKEKASRIRSYNPYWTNVISYHEWLGHNVQIAAANENVTRKIRRQFNSVYFSQSWSFYLEKLLEDEGYFEDTFDHVSALKHRMARLQMRMWRIQRIKTKLKMAKGEMTFDQAVQAYIDKIGMEPTNAFIEVQRDSQTPLPPGREIIGEKVILELRDEYKRRMGDHYRLKNFNDTLITYGDLPFKQIRRLMFND